MAKKRAKKAKPAKKTKRSRAKPAARTTAAARGSNVPAIMYRSESGKPGGGRGRVDVVGTVPEGVRVDPDLTEGHPGYEESGSSELIPTERLARGGKIGKQA